MVFEKLKFLVEYLEVLLEQELMPVLKFERMFGAFDYLVKNKKIWIFWVQPENKVYKFYNIFIKHEHTIFTIIHYLKIIAIALLLHLLTHNITLL